jgi:excinuclease ABC subunit B
MIWSLGRGRFRVKGDVLEIGPAYEDRIIRVEFFGDEIDAIRYVDPVTGATLQSPGGGEHLPR